MTEPTEAAREITDYCSEMYEMPVTNSCDARVTAFTTKIIQHLLDEKDAEIERLRQQLAAAVTAGAGPRLERRKM